MLRIGVTGNIGAGKSVVCRIFELLGVPVYYADPAARSLMERDPRLVEEIKKLFGKGAYTNDGALNRKYLGQIVFKDRNMLEKLNALVHPAVARDFEAWAGRQQATYCIKEAALLFESGSYQELDQTILVVAAENTRLRRVMERDGLTESEVRLRMDKQMPQEEKEKWADHIIDNNGNTGLVRQVLQLHKVFKTLKDQY
jgi:dephospho-CoA kinase